MSNKELSKDVAFALRSPGMKDTVKIALKLSKRNILLLCLLIDRGLKNEDTKRIIPPAEVQELESLSAELMTKGDFEPEFIEGFKEFTTKPSA